MGDFLPLLLVAAVVVGSRRRKKSSSDRSADQDPGGDDSPLGTPGTSYMRDPEPVLDQGVTTYTNIRPPTLNPPDVPPAWNGNIIGPPAWMPGSGATATDGGEYNAVPGGPPGYLSAANYTYNYILQKGLNREYTEAQRLVNFHRRLIRKIFHF